MSHVVKIDFSIIPRYSHAIKKNYGVMIGSICKPKLVALRLRMNLL